MTVATELSSVTRSWTGVETSFSTGIPALDASHVTVVARNPANTITSLVRNIHYTSALDAGTGHLVITPLALPSAPQTLLITRRTPSVQENDFIATATFDAEIVEGLFDAGAMRDAERLAQIADILDRGVIETFPGSGVLDARNRRIINLAPGIAGSDAVRVDQIQNIVASQGSIPLPLGGQVGAFWTATATGVMQWVISPMVNPTAPQVGAYWTAISAGNAGWVIPTPSPLIAGAAQKADNLADLTNKPLAKINLQVDNLAPRPIVLPAAIRNYVPSFCQAYAGEVGRIPHTFDALTWFHSVNSGLGGDGFVANNWVDPVNGNDLTGTGQADAPYKTVQKAFTKAGTGTIKCRSGVITDPVDFLGSSNTISGGTVVRAIKIVAVDGPGSVVFRAPGQQPSEMTWTNPAGDGREWRATPAGIQTADRVLYWPRGINVGEPFFLPFFPTTSFTADEGWNQDLGTKEIRIRNAKDNVNANKAKYEVIYRQDATTVRMNGVNVYWENFEFRGIRDILLGFDGTFRARAWFKNCRFMHSTENGVKTEGGLLVLQDCEIGYSTYDGVNIYAQNTDGSGQRAQVAEIDCEIYGSGVIETRNNQFEVARNRQCSSTHGVADIIRINGRYAKGGMQRRTAGQVIADTSVTGTTVMLGCDLGEPRAISNGSLGLDTYTGFQTDGITYCYAVKGGGGSSTQGWVPTNVNTFALNCAFRGVANDVTGTVQAWNPFA